MLQQSDSESEGVKVTEVTADGTGDQVQGGGAETDGGDTAGGEHPLSHVSIKMFVY